MGSLTTGLAPGRAPNVRPHAYFTGALGSVRRPGDVLGALLAASGRGVAGLSPAGGAPSASGRAWRRATTCAHAGNGAGRVPRSARKQSPPPRAAATPPPLRASESGGDLGSTKLLDTDEAASAQLLDSSEAANAPNGLAGRAMPAGWVSDREKVDRGRKGSKTARSNGSIQRGVAQPASPADVNEKVVQRALREDDLQTAVNVHCALCASGNPPHYAVCNKLVRACCDRSWFPGAWRTFSAADSEGITLAYNTYSSLIRCCLKVNEGAQAVQVFRALKEAGFTPNKVTYCTLISGLLRASRGRGANYKRVARELWDELDASGVPLDAAALRAGVHVCTEVGDTVAVKELEDRMEGRGERKDATTWNMKMHGLGTSGHVDEAARVMDDMRAAGVKPDAVSYNTLINVFVEAGMVDQARLTLLKAQEDGCKIGVRAYATLMKGAAARGGSFEAQIMWDDMVRNDIAPNEVAYMTLVQAYINDREFEKADMLWEEMRAHGHKPSTRAYNMMLQAYAWQAAGHLKTFTTVLDRVFQEMAEEGVSMQADTFNCVIAVMVQYGEYGLAMLLWDKMVGLGFNPDAVTVTALMKAFERQGAPGRALKLFHALPQGSLDTVAWSALAGILAKAEQLDDALEAALSGAELARDRGEPTPIEGFDAVIKGHGQMGDVEGAVRVLQRFLSLGGMPDTRMYENVVYICARGNALRRAMQVIRAMELSGMSMDRNVYQKIVERVEAARQEQRAHEASLQWEKFKFWLGLPNDLYQSNWEP